MTITGMPKHPYEMIPLDEVIDRLSVANYNDVARIDIMTDIITECEKVGICNIRYIRVAGRAIWDANPTVAWALPILFKERRGSD